jgi:hypothetical protein
MPLINNVDFIKLVNCLCKSQPIPIEEFYIGMGNPDSEILVVGQEKALSNGGKILSNDEIQQLFALHGLGLLQRRHLPDNFSATIYNQECSLNVEHWCDIINNYQGLIDPLDQVLSTRLHPFTNFNPFQPLIYSPTWRIVNGRHGHYYYGLQRLINAYGGLQVPPYTTRIIPATPWVESTFSKCFITELSVIAARNTREASFSFENWKKSTRFKFLSGETQCNSNFFRGFKNVIIAAGARYVGEVGTPQREAIIQLFNPHLLNVHCNAIGPNPGVPGIDYMYDFEGNTGSRVVITRNLAAGFGNARANHVAGLMRP